MMLNKKKISLFVAGVSLALIPALGVSTAYANDDWTHGGGAGGGNTASGFYWKGVEGGNGGAWARFMQENGHHTDFNNGNFQWAVNRLRVKPNWDKCRQSKAIWWVHGRVSDGTHVWISGFQGNSFDSGMQTGLRNTISDRALTNRMIDKFSGRSNISIVCSADIPGLEKAALPPRVNKRVETKEEPDSANLYRNRVHTYTVISDRRKIEGKYLDGATRSFPVTNTVRTKFGELYDSLSTGATHYSRDELIRKLNEADRADRREFQLNKDTAFLDLGISERTGGIIDTILYEKTASISANTRILNSYRRECTDTQTWNYDAQKYNPTTTSCGAWTLTNSQESSTINKMITSWLREIASYQTLIVNCNSEGVAPIRRFAENSDSTSNTSFTVQNILVTPLRHGAQSGNPIFGNPYHSNPDLAKTGKTEFYTKLCPLVCTDSTDPSRGASDENDAISNVDSNGMGSYGLKGGTVVGDPSRNGNYFQFFRDNKENEVRVNTMYPDKKALEGSVYSGQGARNTIVTRDKDGTPQTYVTNSEGGKLEAHALEKSSPHKKVLFNSHSNEKLNNENLIPNLQSSPMREFHGDNTTILLGHYNKFSFASSWASTDGKPNVFNIKWIYNFYHPETLVTRGQRLVIKNGVPMKHNDDFYYIWTSRASVNLYGTCTARFGGETSNFIPHAQRELLSRQTGVGANSPYKNELLPFDRNNPADTNTNLVIQFVRSNSE